jgi:hypothetical protein
MTPSLVEYLTSKGMYNGLRGQWGGEVYLGVKDYVGSCQLLVSTREIKKAEALWITITLEDLPMYAIKGSPDISVDLIKLAARLMLEEA